MRSSFLTAALLMLPFCLSARADDTTAPSVSYTWDNQTLTVTPTGSTTINLTPGESFTISGSWITTYAYAGDTAFTQTYLAALAPYSGQIDLGAGYFSNQSGDYSAIFTAPATDGIYYIGGGYSQDYHFDPGITGQANSNGQVSYILNVASTPEPSSFVLLGTGLLGLAGAVKPRYA